MKKLVLVSALLLSATIAFGQQDYALKVTAGTVAAAEIATEIVLDEDNKTLTLEDYKGDGGYEVKFALLLANLEFSYLIQKYSAVKDEDGEEGDITFNIESTGFAMYLFDPLSNPGFNINIGVGKGVAKLTVNKEVAGAKVIDDGVAYAKELNYFIGAHFGIDETFGLSVKKMIQNLNTVTGKEFSNDLTMVELYAQF